MATTEDLLSLLNPPSDETTPKYSQEERNWLFTGVGAKQILGQEGSYITEAEQQRRKDLAEAHKLFFSKDDKGNLIDEYNRPIGAEPTPQWKLDKAKALLDKEAAAAVAPLEQFYNYQMAGGAVPNVPANASPSVKAAISSLATNVAEQSTPIVPGSIEDLKRFSNLQEGKSYRALQDLGIEFPGTGATAPVFRSDAPAKGVPRATPVTPAAVVDKTGLSPVIGSEFGEVDRPGTGGYTEPNWNVGAWGDKIEGKDTKLASLPMSTLKLYGNPNDRNYQKKFNANYDIQVVNPATGQAIAVSLGDKGPAEHLGVGIDLTWGAREALGLPPNFKGGLQMRVVKKGAALPDGTTSSSSAGLTGPTGEAGQAAADRNVYIQPIDEKKLRNPEIYGEKNTPEDNLLWARHQTDQYATMMAQAGTPLTTEEYKDRFKSFAAATEQKVKGEAPKELSREDSDRFASLASTVDQLDRLLAAKLAVPPIGPGGIAGVGYGDKQSEYYQMRNLLTPNISKGLGGQSGAPSDADIARAETLLPTEHDSEDASRAKIANLKEMTRSQMEMMIRIRRGEHFNTTPLEKEFLRLQKNFGASQQAQSMNEKSDKIGAVTPSQTQSNASPTIPSPAPPATTIQPLFK